jgi:hypothetical protein
VRIGVLEVHQENSTPTRHISKRRAESFVYRGIAKWEGKLLRMKRTDSEIRQDMRFMPTMLRLTTRNHRVGREGLLLYYPHKDQESYA